MTMTFVEKGLELFDRYFVHLFITSIHLFFIALSAWLERGDLVGLGLVMFVVSFGAFQWLGQLGMEEKRAPGEP
jgi:hypothetical protein